jgi:undecaprenyl diphosphate synthase
MSAKVCELSALPQDGPFFSQDELHSIQVRPKHIAIIPDGNRRWAGDHNLPFVNGYLEGAQTLIKVALAAKELGISVMTVYSFSTENWKRPKDEIETLMKLVDIHLRFYADSLVNTNIRLHIIGNIEKLPKFLQETIEEVSEKTATGTALDLVLALNYGGRDELVRAFRKLITLYPDRPHEISEEEISKTLDTFRWPDPDLVIRTSGEQRLSNFLLWQCSYAESYTDSALWPDFSPHHLLRAVAAYQTRSRRRGGGEAFRL